MLNAIKRVMLQNNRQLFQRTIFPLSNLDVSYIEVEFV